MRHLTGAIGLLLLIAGCAGEIADGQARRSAQLEAPAAEQTTSEPDESMAVDANAVGEQVTPRIIFNADVELVAEDFDAASEVLNRLVEEVKGYIASASMDRLSGTSRRGRWTVRVPVANYNSFLTSLDSIGFVESRMETSQDVTMEYIDTEARIANLTRLEERFVALLSERTG